MSAAAARLLILLGALLVLGAVNHAIYGKERIRRYGEPILLELAPVDPRSLMQGDYMALRFRLAEAIEPEAPGGSVPLQLDERRVASIAAGGEPDARIRYRVRNGQVWLGTNAFFFEEGTAERYAQARYGEFRVDPRTGEAVLVALRDAEFRPLP